MEGEKTKMTRSGSKAGISIRFRVGVEVAGYNLPTMPVDDDASPQLVFRYTVPRSTEVENLE